MSNCPTLFILLLLLSVSLSNEFSSAIYLKVASKREILFILFFIFVHLLDDDCMCVRYVPSTETTTLQVIS